MIFLFRRISQCDVLPLLILVCLTLAPFVVDAQEVEVIAEVAKLVALDGEEGESFGNAMSLDGDRLAIAAWEDDDNGFDSGSVYVFERDADGSWLEATKLLAFDGVRSDFFGNAVSLQGDRLAIGARWADVGNDILCGAVYVFERDADGSWFLANKLVALDRDSYDSFGASVSLDGDRLVIGATGDDDSGVSSGAVYVFERGADGNWLQADKLLAFDGDVLDLFGTSVSLVGDRLAIGATADDDNGFNSGSVYVLERDAGGDWLQAGKLLALDGEERDNFGNSVSLDGDRVAIGADLDDDAGSGSGSAYVFERDADGSWLQASKLLALDGEEFDYFGDEVSLDGDRLAVGAPDQANGMDSGAAYVFERDAGGDWFQSDKLLSLDGQGGDFFGYSVSLDGDRLAIGARWDDDNGLSSGSTYVFESVLVSPQLTLTGTCPGEVELTSSGTTPRSGIRFYRATALGTSTFESGPCAGTSLGLDMPTVMGETNTDFDPENRLLRTVDVSQCGTYLQVIDLKTCLTSEVVQIQ